MTSALALLLTDYSTPLPNRAPGSPLLRPAKPHGETAAADAAPKQQPADDLGQLIRQAEARAREEERVRARRDLEEALAAAKVRSDEELKVQRALWAEREGERLASCLVQALASLEAMLSDRVANILMPFVSDGIRQQTLSDFLDALKSILSNSSPAPLVITGPQDLLSVVREKLGDRQEAVEFVPSSDTEIRATSADTSIETQLASWSSRLSETLRAD